MKLNTEEEIPVVKENQVVSELPKNNQGISMLQTLINSRRRAVLLNTYEEQRAQSDITMLANTKAYNIITWSVTSGLVDAVTGNQLDHKALDPMRLFDYIESVKEGKPTIFLVKDFHDLWTNFQAKRRVRDFLEKSIPFYNIVVFISPFTAIPSELEKLITVVNYELPDRNRVISLIEANNKSLAKHKLPVLQGEDREPIINALIGMTESEITNVLKKSTVSHRAVVLSEIVAEKEQVIRKTGLLEYITKLGDMDSIGGMDRFKEWCSDAYYAFDPEARNFNIDSVRGVVMTGVPGTAKSLAAKSVAHSWKLPLLKMNMSDIMDSKVGQSEKNIARALKLAEQVSPCVLWIDEIEKGIAGISSSDKSDSGTLSRVVQELLTWLAEKTAPVFVFATANDITKLPPELTRAGRFDEIMFTSLPHLSEREDILRIHLRKRGYAISDQPSEATNVFHEKDVQAIALQMDQFTGAEIEQATSEAGRHAYAQFKKKLRDEHYITYNDLMEQAKKIVPIAKRNPQLVSELREWAQHSAVCASSLEHDFLHNKRTLEPLLSSGLDPESIDFDNK